MPSAFMDKMQASVFKKTGHDLDEYELAELLETYADRSNKQLQSILKRKIRGERGGESVEDTALIDEVEIVLAARRAWE